MATLKSVLEKTLLQIAKGSYDAVGETKTFKGKYWAYVPTSPNTISDLQCAQKGHGSHRALVCKTITWSAPVITFSNGCTATLPLEKKFIIEHGRWLGS
jgi:hypothetical protein